MADRQLISLKDLEKVLGDRRLRVVDCRFDLFDYEAGRAAYLAGHIPGAVFADLNEDLAAPPGKRTGRHPLPTVDAAIAVFGRLGIDQSSHVVVYDGGNGALAARAWWMLRWLGHENVRLLDGGMSAWQLAGLPLECGTTEADPMTFVARVQEERIITTDEIVAAGNNVAELNIVDARDAARFAGKNEPIDPVAGHVPGARNLPLTESMRADGFWKSQAERSLLWQSALGADRDTPWVAMCGSGVTACHLALSAVDAGYAEPRLYVGSWSEWISDPTRPIALEEG